MKPSTGEMLAALKSVEWFSGVGDLVAEEHQEAVITVSSWEEAIQCSSSNAWDDFRLEQQNLVTMDLHEHARERYQHWNAIAREMKAAFMPLVRRKIKSVVKAHGLPDDFQKGVDWDILMACMESEYADIRARTSSPDSSAGT